LTDDFIVYTTVVANKFLPSKQDPCLLIGYQQTSSFSITV